jgi:hypothetical protein
MIIPFFASVFLLLPMMLSAQNHILTEFVELHKPGLTLHFYPSTLRMVNLERNPQFDEMIRHVKKARFYNLDTGTVAPEDIGRLAGQLAASGFEQLMFMKSEEMDIQLWGIEAKEPETIMISQTGHEVMILEIVGMVNIAKVPKLMDTFDDNAFLDVLNLNQKKASGGSTQN